MGLWRRRGPGQRGALGRAGKALAEMHVRLAGGGGRARGSQTLLVGRETRERARQVLECSDSGASVDVILSTWGVRAGLHEENAVRPP